MKHHKPIAILVMGLPGSGKSFFGRHLANKLQAGYFNSDQIRMEMFPEKRSYSMEEKQLVYTNMLQNGLQTLQTNQAVVLDATFYLQELRNWIIGEIQSEGFHVKLIHIWTHESIAKARVSKPRPHTEADYKVYQIVRDAWEEIQQPHLKLESTENNIEQMLSEAITYLAKEHD